MEKPCFIDIHCHIDIYDDKTIEEIIKRARDAGVLIILNNGLNLEVNRTTLELSKKYLEVKAAIGIYPNEAKDLSEKDIDEEIRFIEKNKDKIIGIGEVGIDLKESDDIAGQKKVFEKFIRLSMKIDKPIIVHSRKAELECIEILEKENAKKVVMHCFSGSMKLVDRIIKNNWMLSIPTNVTFSEHFQKVVERTPIEQLFCETDSPFLHPEKGRHDNEPANVIMSYKKIAEIKNLSLEEVKKIIFENYTRIFS